MSADPTTPVDVSLERLVDEVGRLADAQHTANLMTHLQFMVTGLEGPPLSPSDHAECVKIGDQIREQLGLPPKRADS